MSDDGERLVHVKEHEENVAAEMDIQACEDEMTSADLRWLIERAEECLRLRVAKRSCSVCGERCDYCCEGDEFEDEITATRKRDERAKAKA